MVWTMDVGERSKRGHFLELGILCFLDAVAVCPVNIWAEQLLLLLLLLLRSCSVRAVSYFFNDVTPIEGVTLWIF